MDLNNPATWRWVWLVMAVVFLLGEMVTPATFFFLPFAIGAVVAAVLNAYHQSVGTSWAAFISVSIVAFASLWKLGRKLERVDEEQEGVGATRWVGQPALVISRIPQDGVGMVRLQRERWRAESLTGKPIESGAKVTIARMNGTRLVVVPIDEETIDLDAFDDGGDRQASHHTSRITDETGSNEGANKWQP